MGLIILRKSCAVLLSLFALVCFTARISAQDESAAVNGSTSTAARLEQVTWISSVRPPGGSFHIARTSREGSTSKITYLTRSRHNDYKPVISPDGARIAFFRSYSEGGNFFLWNTSICVINADGSRFRELTDHQFMNTEPYWTRDGSNRITWTRMVHHSEGEYGTYVYRTRCDARPGDEERLSATRWEWGNSSLKNGRVFVMKDKAYHLLTPGPNGKPKYEKISYPDAFHYLHKVTISNDEKSIAYMKKVKPGDGDYLGSEIVLARFDASKPSIKKEFTFVPVDKTKFSWYVSFSPDGKYLLYAEDGKIMMYDVAAKKSLQLSTRNEVEYRYPNFHGSVK